MNIILVGSRGSGKSTVGPSVAKRLKMEFVDLDARIVEDAGKSIREIFATEGEAGFRRREREAFQKVKKLKDHVIALGGGALTDPETLSLVRRVGKVVWLRAPAAVLWSRVSKDPHTIYNRPSLTSSGGLAELEAILLQREPIYESAANHVIDTETLSVSEVVEAIELWYEANDAHAY